MMNSKKQQDEEAHKARMLPLVAGSPFHGLAPHRAGRAAGNMCMSLQHHALTPYLHQEEG